ncbi:MAG: hypothetical protein ACJAZT_000602 [Gammaproteobacteria bacterium]|jgi:hypothetical protein
MNRVVATVSYLTKGSGKPIYSPSGSGRDAKFVVDRALIEHPVEVEDARLQADKVGQKYGLDTGDTILLKHQTQVFNFFDAQQLKLVYEAEVASLLLSTTVANRVHCFDHTVRASDPMTREQQQSREPSTLVHNDYTANSGLKCLHESLPHEAEALSKKRFQIINLWRPLVDPVESFPLAFCDSSSIAEVDLVDTERRSPSHIGELILVTYNPAHRWYYFPNMHPGEVLLFKTYDSFVAGRRGCGVHTAIDINNHAGAKKPRESIETRAFLFFD